MIKTLGVVFVALVVALAGVATAQGQKATPAPPATMPADPWPRQVGLPTATLLIYQPQVESWTGNVLTFRSAVAVIASLFVSALAVSGVIFLILEMYAPYGSLIQISKAPLRAAIAHLGH